MPGETPDWNAPLAAPAILSAQGAVNASEVITTVLTTGSVAGRAQALVGLGLSASRPDIDNTKLRALVYLILTDNLGATLAVGTISPETPAINLTYPPGTLLTAVGSQIAGQVVTEAGSGTQLVYVAAFYYLV